MNYIDTLNIPTFKQGGIHIKKKNRGKFTEYCNGKVTQKCIDKAKRSGNKKLVKLYKDEGEGYFKENFTFTLLEYFGLSYDRDEIIIREQYWKRCLQTIKHGYNDN